MKNKRHERRVKRLALIVTLCTIILAVSTYAWFIGMKTVNVSSFNVQIAATEGLSLSLDGENWSETVEINSTNFNSTYSGNTNTWGGDGLIPVSSIGKIDQTSSRLIMFEKGSLTATTGGYRLLASKVKNDTVKAGTQEGTGFVAFDLFVKNLSGKAYYKNFDTRNEEAIYLSQESAVSVVNSGTTDPQLKTGIENSVRVAFAQIGRVEADATTTTAGVIQGLVCQPDKITETDETSKAIKENSTGSCTKDAVIWEPNDTAHVDNAINWYKEACKSRNTDGKDVTLESSYAATACKDVKNGTYSHTYAIGSEIIVDTEKPGVDVYDGTDYNGYTGTINSTTNTTGPLYEVNYFTDTEKMYTGLQRPQFFSLAPNSVTKVRVYVYIEGQDVDNYDFASLGKAITVSFGFTKERFFDTDIDYNGPMSVEKQDNGENVEIAVPTTKDLAA